MRWDDLCNNCNERQQKLEEALLQLGQFQLALTELLVWLKQTDKTLDEQLAKPVHGDIKFIEIELAKHKVQFIYNISVYIECNVRILIVLVMMFQVPDLLTRKYNSRSSRRIWSPFLLFAIVGTGGV